MLSHVQEPISTVHRNFNVCPHCEARGEGALLSRLSEGIPMISRSDGKDFHLLLADHPLPYPIEAGSGPTREISVCFWYAYGHGRDSTRSTVVLLPSSTVKNTNIFRQIEWVADLLADELSRRRILAGFYGLQSDSLQELSY